jgi:hypothetical protein
MVYEPDSLVTNVLVIPRSALVRVIFAPVTKLPERSVTVPLIVAVNACDWADRRVAPNSMPKVNITIVATVCDRVARLNCMGCASLKMVCSSCTGWLSSRQMCCLESDDHPREGAALVSWRITDCLLMFWRLKSRGFSDEINGFISMTWLVSPMGEENRAVRKFLKS